MKTLELLLIRPFCIIASTLFTYMKSLIGSLKFIIPAVEIRVFTIFHRLVKGILGIGIATGATPPAALADVIFIIGPGP
jgi:hypothetical protein